MALVLLLYVVKTLKSSEENVEYLLWFTKVLP